MYSLSGMFQVGQQIAACPNFVQGAGPSPRAVAPSPQDICPVEAGPPCVLASWKEKENTTKARAQP